MLVPKPKLNLRTVQECISIRQSGFGWPFQKGGVPDGERSQRRGADRLTEKATSQQRKLKPRDRPFRLPGGKPLSGSPMSKARAS